jgi:hypothetical protein
MAQPRTARIGPAFIWGIAGFCLVGLIVWIFRGTPSSVDAYEEKRAAERTKVLEELRQEAHQKLTEYAVVDKEKGTFRIPITQAMEVALNELREKGLSPSAEKVEILPSLIVPPYLKPAAPEEAAPAASPAPAEAPANEAAPAATPGAPAPEAPAAPAEAAPSSQPATPAAPSEN